jgi:hypothetical protein
MSKQTSAEDWRPSQLPEEERLQKALGEIERVSAELRFEQAVDEIDRVAKMLRLRSQQTG